MNRAKTRSSRLKNSRVLRVAGPSTKSNVSNNNNNLSINDIFKNVTKLVDNYENLSALMDKKKDNDAKNFINFIDLDRQDRSEILISKEKCLNINRDLYWNLSISAITYYFMVLFTWLRMIYLVRNSYLLNPYVELVLTSNLKNQKEVNVGIREDWSKVLRHFSDYQDFKSKNLTLEDNMHLRLELMKEVHKNDQKNKKQQTNISTYDVLNMVPDLIPHFDTYFRYHSSTNGTDHRPDHSDSGKIISYHTNSHKLLRSRKYDHQIQAKYKYLKEKQKNSHKIKSKNKISAKRESNQNFLKLKIDWNRTMLIIRIYSTLLFFLMIITTPLGCTLARFRDFFNKILRKIWSTYIFASGDRAQCRLETDYYSTDEGKSVELLQLDHENLGPLRHMSRLTRIFKIRFILGYLAKFILGNLYFVIFKNDGSFNNYNNNMVNTRLLESQSYSKQITIATKKFKTSKASSSTKQDYSSASDKKLIEAKHQSLIYDMILYDHLFLIRPYRKIVDNFWIRNLQWELELEFSDETAVKKFVTKKHDEFVFYYKWFVEIVKLTPSILAEGNLTEFLSQLIDFKKSIGRQLSNLTNFVISYLKRIDYMIICMTPGRTLFESKTVKKIGEANVRKLLLSSQITMKYDDELCYHNLYHDYRGHFNHRLSENEHHFMFYVYIVLQKTLALIMTFHWAVFEIFGEGAREIDNQIVYPSEVLNWLTSIVHFDFYFLSYLLIGIYWIFFCPCHIFLTRDTYYLRDIIRRTEELKILF